MQQNKKSGSADVISRAAHSLFSFLLSAPQAASAGPEVEENRHEVKRPKLVRNTSHSAPVVHTDGDIEAVLRFPYRSGKQTSVQVRHTIARVVCVFAQHEVLRSVVLLLLYNSCKTFYQSLTRVITHRSQPLQSMLFKGLALTRVRMT